MYDPLKNRSPGRDIAYPDSYWQQISVAPPPSLAAPAQDLSVDVAIIGAGYTGLSCALHLATEYGIKAHVFEANQTAWGCSGRNAGFVLKSTGRKSYASMIKQWGLDVAKAHFREVDQGLENIDQLVTEIEQKCAIDCQVQSKGYLKVAHKASQVAALKQQMALLQTEFGEKCHFLNSGQIKSDYFNSQNAYGALFFEQGYGLNPLNLAFGYQTLAQQAGVSVYTGSPVKNLQKRGGSYQFDTPQATINAKKVVIATNGYTPFQFHSIIDRRIFPVLSQIIVTQPLSAAQLAECHFVTSNVVMDTRALKYYFRKLADNRILFGGRGAISGKDAEDPYYADRLLNMLKVSFPALHDLDYQYTWSGWICISMDDMPHIASDQQGDLIYSAGYCGNGVAFAAQAGKRMAQKLAGISLPTLPYYQSALKPFPIPALRRLGQAAYFQYGKLKDHWF